MIGLAGCDDHGAARSRRDLAGVDLGAHAAARQFGCRTAGHRLDLGSDDIDDIEKLRIRIEMRRCRVKPVDIRQENQKIGTGHGGDARGKPVVVAVADFGCRDGVVFVDDRDSADLQKLVDRGAGVEIAATLFRIAQRQQDLSRDDPIPRKAFRPGAGKRDLADGSSCLAFLELERAVGQVEHGAAKRDCARRDHQNLDTLGSKLCDIGADRIEPLRFQTRLSIDQQGRADLDHDPAMAGERLAAAITLPG